MKKYIYSLALIALIIEAIFIYKYFPKKSELNQTQNQSKTEVIEQSIQNLKPQKPAKTKTFITNTNQIFEQQPQAQTNDSFTITSTGDIMLGRAVNIKTIEHKDFSWAFKNISETLKDSDLTFINLENPLFENCPSKNTGMIFCASEKHTQGLLLAGIDAASLSNNHTFNYGEKGISDTIKILEDADIVPVGMENPKYITKNGVKIALLAYNQIECTQKRPDSIYSTKIKNEIAIAKQNSEFVVIMFHWGVEYQSKPTQNQIDIAYQAIDDGADMILGNHPHWIQPLEIYKDKLIVYSHGNTIFDQMWSQKTREGIIVKTTIDKASKKIEAINIYPTLIEDFGQPKILNQNISDYANQIEYLKKLSINN